MDLSAEPTTVEAIAPWRGGYRHEMNCQIIHDSLHERPGWTKPYLLRMGGAPVGYGSVAVGGPWRDRAALFEFYVLPPYRARSFDLFEALLAASGPPPTIETQSNDPFLTVMLHTYARDVTSESILFHDRLTTAHRPPGDDVVFRRADAADAPALAEVDAGAEWVVTVGGAVASAGGVLYHYNRPYGDVYMAVAEPFRRRGLGAYFVQELKRVCYEGGSVPAARCNVTNVASRRTLQKAGFVPCGHILVGAMRNAK